MLTVLFPRIYFKRLSISWQLWLHNVLIVSHPAQLLIEKIKLKIGVMDRISTHKFKHMLWCISKRHAIFMDGDQPQNVLWQSSGSACLPHTLNNFISADFFYNPKSDFKIVILKIPQSKAVRCLLGISNEKSFKYLGVLFS